jgi:hypothetical protein
MDMKSVYSTISSLTKQPFKTSTSHSRINTQSILLKIGSNLQIQENMSLRIFHSLRSSSSFGDQIKEYKRGLWILAVGMGY